MKFAGLLLASFALASCATNVIPPSNPPPARENPVTAYPLGPAIDKRGLEAVMGKDIGTLKRLFGEPRLDVIEVNGRKLQFVGKACVLDTYLYREGKNGTEIVTYVDARRGDGAAVDRASCVDALQRR